MRRRLVRRTALRVMGGAMGARAASRNGHPDDVEGTAVDVDPDRIEHRREAP